MHAHAVGNGGIESVEVLDLPDDLPGAVRDAFELPGVVGDGVHEPQPVHPHIRHRADDATDVDRVLGLKQNNENQRIEERG
jgi:hypothetical protein